MKINKIIIAVLIIVTGFVISSLVVKNRQNSQTEPTSTLQNAVILETKTNSNEAVSISVTPKNISDKATFWDFEISLNTHSVELSEDLTQISVLVDADGNRHIPTSWIGDPPGGHHRIGVLKFQPISPLPQTIELRINLSGEIQSFIWDV